VSVILVLCSMVCVNCMVTTQTPHGREAGLYTKDTGSMCRKSILVMRDVGLVSGDGL
jgi:hypothetical protein